jgi:hypothetical protein
MKARRSLIGFALACLLLPFPAEQATAQGKLRGEYGFLSSKVLGPHEQSEIRARVDTMARDYGIREFMFYDWCADYSHPVAGERWTDPFFHRHPISRRTIEISIDEIHRKGGRAWAYVQAIAAEEQNLEDPKRDIWKLRDAKGEWYWHPPDVKKPRFPTYFANAAWTGLMVDRWARPAKQLGFDGIHWDTLGRIAGDGGAEAAGMHAFIATAHRLLEHEGLRQTMNMVDLAWWDRALVRHELEFSYAKTWSQKVCAQYFGEMDRAGMVGVRGVLAMYPSTALPAGTTEAEAVCTRHAEAKKHRLTYLIVGDGACRMKNEYWPETIPLNAEENDCLRAMK